MIYTEPLLHDLVRFEADHIRDAKYLSVDIETRDNQITCIGFAPATNIALVVPFEDLRKPGGSYWGSLEAELAAWEWVRHVLDGPVPKVFQNGLYDLHRLWRSYGIPVKNVEHDTMLLHHALQPESPKGLDYLGSIYTNEAAWKLTIRMKHKETIKKED